MTPSNQPDEAAMERTLMTAKFPRSVPLSGPTLFVLFFLMATAALLVTITELRQEDYLDNQHRLMSVMTRSTANEIHLLVDKYRHAVTVFAEDNAGLLTHLMDDAQNEKLLAELQQRVRRHFPNSFGVTIAAPDGEVLLDNFDGIVGEICVRDLQAFATTRHANDIFVHPHAEVYHFDMPVILGIDGIDMAVFFVSFRLDEVARLLHAGAPPQHDFMLLNKDDPDLIEVTAQGSRAILGEHIRLDEQTRERIAFKRVVEGTEWLLVSVPAPGLISGYHVNLYQQSVPIYVLLLLGSIYALRQFLREERTRKLAEGQLREKNQALTQSYAQLQNAQNRLVEAEKMASLGGLVAGVSHEINTPIGIAITAASTLQEQSEETRRKLADEALTRTDFEQFLETCTRVSELTESNLCRAAQLIRSFKQVAVDQSSEKRRRFRLGDYVEEVMLSLQPQLSNTPHRYRIECIEEQEIDSYPGAISQIITNLVLNSLQHGFSEKMAGLIEISITRQNEMAVITYHDNGRGVAVEDRGKVFEPFYTTARNRGGSGLGLSIVYNLIVQMLGGLVEWGDNTEQGFTLILKIPIRNNNNNPEVNTSYRYSYVDK